MGRLTAMLTSVGILAIGTTSTVAHARGTEFIQAEIRAIPALGFFPMWGDVSVEDSAMRTYLVGGSAGIINTPKWTVVDASAVLFGLKWSDIGERSDGNSEAIFSNMAYVRVGPRFRFLEDGNGIERLGFQVGWGAVLLSDMHTANTFHQRGLDISFDVTLLRAK